MTNKGYTVLMQTRHKVQQRAECQQLLLRLPLVIIFEEQNALYMCGDGEKAKRLMLTSKTLRVCIFTDRCTFITFQMGLL